MVVVVSRFGFVASSTVPALMVALPALVSAAEVWMAPAAARPEGSVSATLMVAGGLRRRLNQELVARRGRSRQHDRQAGGRVSGLAAVPAPVSGDVGPGRGIGQRIGAPLVGEQVVVRGQRAEAGRR